MEVAAEWGMALLSRPASVKPAVLTQWPRELEARAVAWRQQQLVVPLKVTYGLMGMGNGVHAALKAFDAQDRLATDR